MHTCFSLIIGLTCFFLVRTAAVRLAWLFYPCLIVFSIVATGNHFWLDAILGAALACVALGVAWTDRAVPPDAAGLRATPAAPRSRFLRGTGSAGRSAASHPR